MSPSRQELPADAESIVEKVRERYGNIAEGNPSGCCSSAPEETSCRIGYDTQDLERVPEGSNLGLGCGAPVSRLELRPGETVLDLGCGGGLDCFLAAERVGAEGRVIGVDMTEEMIALATKNAADAGLSQVEFRRGRLEQLPVDDASVDAVTSNCVINLVPDKARVFREVARVLRRGGRLVISDVVLDGELPEGLRRDLLAYVGCVAGAMQRSRYFDVVADAGLGQIQVLDDRDALADFALTLPPELAALADSAGVSLQDVEGKVRSVTFRASKP